MIDDLETFFHIASRPAPVAGDPQVAALLDGLDLGPGRAVREAAALERASVDPSRSAEERGRAQAFRARLAQG